MFPYDRLDELFLLFTHTHDNYYNKSVKKAFLQKRQRETILGKKLTLTACFTLSAS